MRTIERRIRDQRSVAVALLVLLGACGGPVPEPTGTPEAQATGPAASPPAGATARPDLSSDPGTPSPSLSPSSLGWRTIADGPPAERMLRGSFSAGYLAIGTIGDPAYGNSAAWFSPDGTTWEVTGLSTTITPCPGGGRVPSAYAATGWAAGGGALILGTEFTPGAAACDSERVVVWGTSDGRTWTKWTSFGGSDLAAAALAVWAVDGGWELAVQDAAGAISIWASSGADRWDRIATLSEGELDTLGTVAVSTTDGRRLLSMRTGESPADTLMTSVDGSSWEVLDGQIVPDDVAATTVSHILSPDRGRRDWLVVSIREGDDIASFVHTSEDLAGWETSPFPRPLVGWIGHTPAGILALGMDACRDTGTPCDPAPQYFLSEDGRTWEALAAAAGPASFSEGPAGIIGLGGGQVYALGPYERDLAFLLSGLRDDASGGCSVREALPDGATAGIECSPSTGPADLVGAYLFPSRQAMLAAYVERLGDEGIEPQSGGCPSSPGEAAYVPPAGGEAAAPDRLGCFVNAFGKANLRITYPTSSVYVGLLGRGEDMGELYDWAWAGNVDQPGAPTIWRDPGPAASP